MIMYFENMYWSDDVKKLSVRLRPRLRMRLRLRLRLRRKIKHV